MTTLLDLHKRFAKRSTILLNRAQDIQEVIPTLEDWRLRYLTEGIISDLWQLWYGFCRSVVLFSCAGTKSRTGSLISTRVGDNSWQRVAYEARCAANGQKTRPHKRLQYHRQEPTWGDQMKIIEIVSKTKPSNASVLVTAFGLPLQGPRHLQIVRNACAHKDNEALGDVRQLLVYYMSPRISSPCDMAWLIDHDKKHCGIYSWSEDLRLIANEATKA